MAMMHIRFAREDKTREIGIASDGQAVFCSCHQFQFSPRSNKSCKHLVQYNTLLAAVAQMFTHSQPQEEPGPIIPNTSGPRLFRAQANGGNRTSGSSSSRIHS